MHLSWIMCLIVALNSETVLLDSTQKPPNCGGTFDTFIIQLHSSDYLQPWERCEFEVVHASDSVCALDIDLGSLVLPACPSDMLVVGGRTFCGSDDRVIHVPFLEPRTNITLQFGQSPSADAAFNITVHQVECNREDDAQKCGGQFSEDTVVIQSPGYPVGYSDKINCHYTIIPTDQSICLVEIAFSDSALEWSPNCLKDSLTLGAHRMCGPLEGVVVLGMKGAFDITFTTDNEVSDKGFNMTVRQKRCQNSHPFKGPQMQHEKQDLVAPQQHKQFEEDKLSLFYGYPVEMPFPPFPMSTSSDLEDHSLGYLPPSGVGGGIPLEEDPPIEPPFRQSHPATLMYDCTVTLNTDYPQNEKFHSLAYLPPEDYKYDTTIFGKQKSVPSQSFQQNVPQFELNNKEYPPTAPFLDTYLNQKPFNSYNTNFPPSLPSQNSQSSDSLYSTSPVNSNIQQCCGFTYSENHFLIVSPNFPKSQSSNCVYTLSRFTPNTVQLHFRFRYFLLGEQTNGGCSDFLEIDGTRFCGCRTGLLWTTEFFDHEISKTLHLKIDSLNDKSINGFVIEVFQEDSYSQRFKRLSGDSRSINKQGTITNVNQYVETTVERQPFFVPRENYPLRDPSVQFWRPQSDVVCTQGSLQNLQELIKTTLWSKYQCPVNNGARVNTACRSCLYFCRQNCKCCLE